MRCSQVRRTLSEYLDEKVSEQGRMAVGLHLARCGKCRHAYDELRRLRLALLSTPKAASPAEFTMGWRTLLRHEQHLQQAKRHRAWYLNPAALMPAAACLILFAIGARVLLPFVSTRTAPKPKLSASLPGTANKHGAAINPEQQRIKPPTAAASLPGAPVPAGGPQQPVTKDGSSSGQGGVGSGGPGGFSTSERPAATDYSGTRQSSTYSASATTPAPASEYQVDLTGSWRVWLSGLGDQPELVESVLREAGLSEINLDRTALELPLPLCVVSVYSNAQNLMYRLEEAGATVIVERLPQ